MKTRLLKLSTSILALFMLVLGSTQATAQVGVQSTFLYLPLITKAICPGSSSNSYNQGIVTQYDLDSPVRPAYNHGGKNWSLRGYTERTGPGFTPGLLNYGPGTDPDAPQFTTFFSPRISLSGHFYQTYDWNFSNPPDPNNPGTRGPIVTSPPITAIGLTTTPGEAIRLPNTGPKYDLGQSVRAIVIYADADSITLKYTREDSVATGYTVFVENICTDTNLLALYNSLDNSTRNTFIGRGAQFYNLPTLTLNQSFGTARSTQIVVGITDTGSFLDPRSCNDWWVGYGGYGAICTTRPPGN